MEAEGVSYENVLKEAQELGYAEADPSLDVGGQDARSKLKILCRLAFGQVCGWGVYSYDFLVLPSTS